MKLFVIVISYILLNLLGSLSYIGILLLFLVFIKEMWSMNEAKWEALFTYQKGKGMYYVMSFPYLLTLILLFPLSMFWFEWIDFEYRVAGSLSIIVLLTLTGIINFSKLRNAIQERYTS